MIKCISVCVLVLLCSCANPKVDNHEHPKGLILVGINHPVFQEDTKRMQWLADTIVKKSHFFKHFSSFSTGTELLSHLTNQQDIDSIDVLLIMGHSGYQGYFTEQNAGFYRDEYHTNDFGKQIHFSNNSARVSDLVTLIQNNKVKFSKKSIILLAGCNTAYGDVNIADELSKQTGITVIGTTKKIDLFNVINIGAEFKALDTCRLKVYRTLNEPYELDFPNDSLYKIDEVIHKVFVQFE